MNKVVLIDSSLFISSHLPNHD